MARTEVSVVPQFPVILLRPLKNLGWPPEGPLDQYEKNRFKAKPVHTLISEYAGCRFFQQARLSQHATDVDEKRYASFDECRPPLGNLRSSAPQVSIPGIIYRRNHIFVSHMFQIARAHVSPQNPFISCQFPVSDMAK